MSDEQASAPQEGEAQQRRIQLRDTGISTLYANFFSLTGGQDAVLLTFGNQFGPDVVQLESKIVLSPRNAKRLALSLGQVIRAYEEQHGEIDVRVVTPPTSPDQQQPGDEPGVQIGPEHHQDRQE